MTNYTVVTIALDAGADAQQIAPAGQAVEDVYVDSMTTGAAVSIQFGNSGGSDKQVTLVDGIAFRLCPPETDGVFLTYAAQPGATIRLVLGGIAVARGV